MGIPITQMAPVLAVLGLAGYCCWSESDDLIVAPTRDKSAKNELTSALLSPATTPVPARNPFPSNEEKKAAPPPVKTAVKEDAKRDLGWDTSHLVLRAIFIHGDRRLAMINGKFYGEGDIVAATTHEPSDLSTDKKKPANSVKNAAPACRVALVNADSVVLLCEGHTMELKFSPSDRKSRSASPGVAKPRVKGGNP